MDIAIHNPSSIDTNTVQFHVPEGDYKVEFFNSTSKQFEKTKSEIYCFRDYANSLDHEFNNCKIHAQVYTPSYDISYLRLSGKAVNETSLEEKKADKGALIENERFILTFKDFSVEKSEVNFNFLNKATNQSENMTFSLRYWQSYMKDGDQKSGDYIFRPLDKQYEPYVYSKFERATFKNGELAQQFSFFFLDTKYDFTDDSSSRAIVHASLDSELPLIRFDVDLGSLPDDPNTGYEVTANF